MQIVVKFTTLIRSEGGRGRKPPKDCSANMVIPDYSRKAYDILVYGASGYTGRYVAKYIHSLGLGLKWAIGGRSQSKLASLMAELRGLCEMGLPGIYSSRVASKVTY